MKKKRLCPLRKEQKDKDELEIQFILTLEGK